MQLLFGADSHPSYKRPLTRLCSSLKDSPSTYPEKIILENNSGEKLSGILQDAGSNELVILCHGFRSSKESKTISHLGDALASKGISSFRFDFSGNGESEGNFEYGNYYKEVEDLRTMVHFFKEQNRDVTAILGHSKGGNVVLLYALKYRDIYSVVNLAGRFDSKGGIKERLGEDYMERIRGGGFLDVKDKFGKVYRVTEASLMERIGIDMRATCLSLDQSCRVLTVHGSKDSTVPPSDAMEFSKVIKNHRLEIIEGADHRFSAHLVDMSDIVVEFVRLGLKDASISY
jgi:uncharacterized protein